MIADVKAYARTRLRALGYTEWSDGFNFVNIPRTKLDTAFHLDLGDAIGVSNNQDNQVIDVALTVRLFRAAARDPKSLIDVGVAAADVVICDFLSAANRLTQTGVQNVAFDAVVVEPLDETNDNGVIIKMQFTMLVIIGTR